MHTVHTSHHMHTLHTLHTSLHMHTLHTPVYTVHTHPTCTHYTPHPTCTHYTSHPNAHSTHHTHTTPITHSLSTSDTPYFISEPLQPLSPLSLNGNDVFEKGVSYSTSKRKLLWDAGSGAPAAPSPGPATPPPLQVRHPGQPHPRPPGFYYLHGFSSPGRVWGQTRPEAQR